MPTLRSYIRRLARDRERAGDLLQETCLRILVAKTAPDEAARFASWCRGVARHVAAEERRRHLRSDGELTLDAGVLDGKLQSNSEHYVQVMENLARFAGSIDPEGLELLVRHYVLEERICDLASERGLSAASLRMRLMRLRSALRRVRE